MTYAGPRHCSQGSQASLNGRFFRNDIPQRQLQTSLRDYPSIFTLQKIIPIKYTLKPLLIMPLIVPGLTNAGDQQQSWMAKLAGKTIGGDHSDQVQSRTCMLKGMEN
jgi:hypothetical protein